MNRISGCALMCALAMIISCGDDDDVGGANNGGANNGGTNNGGTNNGGTNNGGTNNGGTNNGGTNNGGTNNGGTNNGGTNNGGTNNGGTNNGGTGCEENLTFVGQVFTSAEPDPLSPNGGTPTSEPFGPHDAGRGRPVTPTGRSTAATTGNPAVARTTYERLPWSAV